MAKLIFLVVLSFLSISLAIEQYLTVYSEPDYKGDSITFRSKQPSIFELNRFFVGHVSFQSRGYWRIFNGSDYTGSALSLGNSDVGTTNSGTTSLASFVGSVRHGGLLDTAEQSISFYSGTSLQGIERIITTPESNDISFQPASILSTGRSNWTFFTGPSFDGTATCYISNSENHFLANINSTLSSLRSIAKGCLGRIDTFLFAEDYEEKSTPLQKFTML